MANFSSPYYNDPLTHALVSMLRGVEVQVVSVHPDAGVGGGLQRIHVDLIVTDVSAGPNAQALAEAIAGSKNQHDEKTTMLKNIFELRRALSKALVELDEVVTLRQIESVPDLEIVREKDEQGPVTMFFIPSRL
jgi:hypothetical protein